MSDINEQRRLELEQWQKDYGSERMPPEYVVQRAADPDTHCHSAFQWDDSEAAKAYRLIQARTLLRVVVTLLPNRDDPVRAYVSLIEDRKLPGGGYRHIVDVLDSPILREQLVRTALIELKALQRRYKYLQELAEVFAAIERLDQQSKTVETEEPEHRAPV